jgi:hypothetical protein
MGRRVGLWVEEGFARDQIIEAALAQATGPSARLPTDDACCCRRYQDGCSGALVCHGAPVEFVQQILEDGALLSRPAKTGKPLRAVAEEMKEWGQPDPVDYFDYVCLANGDCVAPDKVAMERYAGGWLSTDYVDEHFYPAARFFFDPTVVAQHPRVAWDGVNAIKGQALAGAGALSGCAGTADGRSRRYAGGCKHPNCTQRSRGVLGPPG